MLNMFFGLQMIILEKFLLKNSRHARSDEMRLPLYQCHPKFGQARLPTNAPTNADFLMHVFHISSINQIGQKHVKLPLPR